MNLHRRSISGDRVSVLRKISGLEIVIDPIPANRKTAETEWWILKHTIPHLEPFKTAELVRVQHRDRPDFEVDLDGTKIGIEITECIPEAEGALLARASKLDTTAFSNLDAWRNPKNTKPKTIERYLGPDHSPAPARGNEFENLLADQIVSSVREKINAIQKYDAAHFKMNWLILYDRSSFPGTNRNKAVSLARIRIEEMRAGDWFDTIVLLSSDSVLSVL